MEPQGTQRTFALRRVHHHPLRPSAVNPFQSCFLFLFVVPSCRRDSTRRIHGYPGNGSDATLIPRAANKKRARGRTAIFRNPVAGPSETRRFQPGSSNTPTPSIELTDQRLKLCHNCWQHFKRQYSCTSSISASIFILHPSAFILSPTWPQNARCIASENLFSDTMRALSTRAQFWCAGGTHVFTILTILKPTRAVTSEKVGGFARLRCIAMQNSLPRKSQNGPFHGLFQNLEKSHLRPPFGVSRRCFAGSPASMSENGQTERSRAIQSWA